MRRKLEIAGDTGSNPVGGIDEAQEVVKIKKKINVEVEHAEPAFFSDNVTVSHSPQKFVIDFTQTTPRFDVIINQRQQTFTIKHKTILLDPVLAKNFLNALNENIKRYEKNFGRIKLSKRKAARAKPAVEEFGYHG